MNPIFDTDFLSRVRQFDQNQAAIGSQASFQNFERHCSITALDVVKCGYTAVALKILKTCLGAYRSLFLIEMSNAAEKISIEDGVYDCLLYTSPSPRDGLLSRMPSSA